MSGAREAQKIVDANEGRSAEWLRCALSLEREQMPFPWQIELLGRFLRGEAVPALDIPTGLGKTATMAIWLVVRALGAALPCRLVYVVDRRAVVDQATEAAEALRAWVQTEREVADALELGNRALPISTLRGQHVDNREWLEDPSVSAIVVGTVDMIGSRLLFSGYGVSSKMRPYHAGLLGTDTLVVLDEAHLVPAFEDLLRQVERGSDIFGPKDPGPSAPTPRFSLLSLSATGHVRAECCRLVLPELRVESRDVRGVPGIGLVGDVRLSLGQAISGPILLGKSRYFGGGLFRAVQGQHKS